MTAAPTKRRRWLRFGIRSILVLMVLVAIPLAWIANRAHLRAVAAIEAVGGRAGFDYEDISFEDMLQGKVAVAPGPPLLRSILGENFFAKIVSVFLYSTAFDLPSQSDKEHILSLLSQMHDIKHMLVENATDVDLEHISRVPSISSLIFDGTFTDAGVAELMVLPNLEEIRLFSDHIGEPSVIALSRYTKLQRLWVYGKGLSEEDARILKAALPECDIVVNIPSPRLPRKLKR